MLTGAKLIATFFTLYIFNSAHNLLRLLKLDQRRKKSNLHFHGQNVIIA
jgi:hypothetical protein